MSPFCTWANKISFAMTDASDAESLALPVVKRASIVPITMYLPIL